jgi:endonuclease/exonuclease/phosphatase family metal-dependent hydrolase
MKLKITLLLTIILTALNLRAQDPVSCNATVKVLSFNILHGATTQGNYDLDVIARVILEADPDLVALQEVDFRTNRVRKLDLATELGLRVRMAPLFGRAMYYDGGEYGDGILSKYSFISTRNVPLPYSPGNEPRTALEAVVVLPSGDTIAFVGTHLDHLKNEKDRVAQVMKINEVFAANPEPTFPSDVPRIKIDYVMHFPKERWKTLDTKVIRDSIASDHCAYLVTLELLNK